MFMWEGSSLLLFSGHWIAALVAVAVKSHLPRKAVCLVKCCCLPSWAALGLPQLCCWAGLASDGGHSLAGCWCLTVYKWVLEEGFGAGCVFPGTGLVFLRRCLLSCCSRALAAVLVATHDTSRCQNALWFLSHGHLKSLRCILWPECHAQGSECEPSPSPCQGPRHIHRWGWNVCISCCSNKLNWFGLCFLDNTH